MLAPRRRSRLASSMQDRKESVDPRVEAVRIAEARKVAPGDHQRVLQGVLGPIDVAEDPLCDPEEAVARERTRSTNAA